jgi:hypothetical protein
MNAQRMERNPAETAGNMDKRMLVESQTYDIALG